MSKMAELDWQIELRACEENMEPAEIAKELSIPIGMVEDWFQAHGISYFVSAKN